MFTISLYNLKGGVGKTASCVNLAYLAARDGYRTLVWDLDPQGAASYYFQAEVESHPIKKLMDGNVELESLIGPTPYKNLDIVPSSFNTRKLDAILQNNDGGKKQLRNILKRVSHDYDFIFIDCPPAFSLLSENIFVASDAILMPVIPTTLSRRTYQMVKEYFHEKGDNLEKLMCFFTMVDDRKSMHIDVMKELLGENRFFDHYIPYLSDIEKMGIHRKPVALSSPSSYAATCYQALWQDIKDGVIA